MNIHGILHKLVVALVIFVGFGIALGYPQYKKHKNIVRAQEALELGREIAYKESVYFERIGRYQPDLSKLKLSVSCPLEEKDGQQILVCTPYTYYLKDSIVRVDHETLPEWFELDVDAGSVDCAYDEGSWAGEHICDRMDLSSWTNLVL